MSRKILFYGLIIASAAALSACASHSGDRMAQQNMSHGGMRHESMHGQEMMSGKATTFRVRIRDVSTKSTLKTRRGAMPVPLSPGVYAVHGAGVMPIFTAGRKDRGQGLEALAEDGFPMQLAHSLNSEQGVESSGVFAVPEGAQAKGPLKPGHSYSFEIHARPGDRLSFATMFVPSDDLFFAPEHGGIALFDADGKPISGNVTYRVMLWDAGTEVNEAPGIGPDTKPNQGKMAHDVGHKESRPVRPIGEVHDGYDYPDVGTVIEVTVTPQP